MFLCDSKVTFFMVLRGNLNANLNDKTLHYLAALNGFSPSHSLSQLEFYCARIAQ